MESLRAAPSRVEAPALRRAVTGAAIGNGVEWFDFGVYGYLAATLGAVSSRPAIPPSPCSPPSPSSGWRSSSARSAASTSGPSATGSRQRTLPPSSS